MTKVNQRSAYIRPRARTLAYALRENIAASASVGTVEESFCTETSGSLTFTHALPGCNDYLNSTRLDSGLCEGCYDIDHLLTNLRNAVSAGGEYANGAAELLHLLETMGPEGFNCA